MLESSFVHTSFSSRVVFGASSRNLLAEEISRLGACRALILTTPEQLELGDMAQALLGESAVGHFGEARQHVPVEIARDAQKMASDSKADCIVAIGGGSTIGLGKAIALQSALPVLALPTTYAGSEMTPIYGLTEGSNKRTGRDVRVLPRTVIYDPDLTLTLPLDLSVMSGLNAIAHCAEGLYATDRNPITSLLAEESIRTFAASLPRIKACPTDRQARSDCLYAAWLAGSVLAITSVALHHKLCHTMGGMLNLPHAHMHAIVLPHSIAYNAPAAPEAMCRLGRALGSSRPAQALFDLARDLDVPMDLNCLGVQPEQLPAVATAALAAPYPNPRELSFEGILGLLRDAQMGRRPQSD